MKSEDEQLYQAAKMGLKFAAKTSAKGTPLAPAAIALDVAPAAVETAQRMKRKRDIAKEKMKAAHGLRGKAGAAARGLFEMQKESLRGSTKMGIAALASSEVAGRMMKENPMNIDLSGMGDEELELLMMNLLSEMRRRRLGRTFGSSRRNPGGIRPEDVKVVHDTTHGGGGVYRIHIRYPGESQFKDTGKYTFSQERADQMVERILEEYS